ncbi:MAG TPA: hypothetical protein VMV49_09625 [Candidatus Deferrimicrobium sp.]|nr:hypothetical protein [Candidatus Deferrimicrobium sp.]
MKKEKDKVIIAKAQELNLYSIPPIKLWVKGTHCRRTFGGVSNNAADSVMDYLDRNDSGYLLAAKKSISGHTHYYHLAPNLQAYIDVYIRTAGFYAYNPDNFPTEIEFHTQNQDLIRAIAGEIQKVWGIPMLDNLDYKKFEKHFNVTAQQIKEAWERWAGSNGPAPVAATPESPPPFCSKCGKPTTFIPQYNRYYCYPCEKYV